jgi:hypothetical protein
MKVRYGDTILKDIDEFYSLKSDNLERTFLESHPRVEEAMNWKMGVVQQDPLLSIYYGGLTSYENWLRSIMERNAEGKFNSQCPEGYNIRTLNYAYNELSGEDRTRFLNRYPVLGEYTLWREEELNKIGLAIENAANLFPDSPKAITRPDYQYVTMGAADLQLELESQKTPQELQAEALIRSNELQSDAAGDFQLTQYIRIESEKMWPGVMNKVLEWNNLKKTNPGKATAYYRQADNWDLRAQDAFDSKVYDIYSNAKYDLKDQQGNYINFVDIMGNELFRIVEDYLLRGENIPAKQEEQLEKIAARYNMTVEELLSKFR